MMRKTTWTTIVISGAAVALCAVGVLAGLRSASEAPKSCCSAKVGKATVSAAAARVSDSSKASAQSAPPAGTVRREAADYETSTSAEPPAGLKSVSFPNAEERKFWRTAAKKLFLRPPCCGACSFLKQADFREIGSVLRSDATPTGESIRIWNRYGPSLAASLRNQDPQLYKKYQALSASR